MATRPRVLIAAQPAAGAVLQHLLHDVADLLLASTAVDAFEVLGRDGIEVILSSFAFDDSRMIEFLMELKRNAKTATIPVVCIRVFRQRFSDELVEQWGAIAMQCGAAAFVDITRMDDHAARKALANTVAACAARRACQST